MPHGHVKGGEDSVRLLLLTLSISSECSLVLLSLGLLSNPLIHPGQNKDVQVGKRDSKNTAKVSDKMMLSGNN